MKILIVDDEEFVRNAIKRVFRKEDYKIAEAVDGQEALQKLEEESFDVLITDNDTPNKKGIELIQELKQGNRISKNPDLIMILFTGKYRPENLPEDIGFFTKPWKDEELRAMLKKIQLLKAVL